MPWKLILAGLVLVGAGLGLAQNRSIPDGLPACSGLASWGPERYLVCHELKAGQAGARFGMVQTQSRLSYLPLETDWRAAGEIGNDIESIAPVEGMPGNFLASESGYFHGQYGRLFWLQAEDGPTPRLQILHTYTLPPNLDQGVEGLATFSLGNSRWLILLGGRGGKAEEASRLRWGVLNHETSSLEWPAEGLVGTELIPPRRLGAYTRTLSDMFVDDRHHLWISSCSSPGKLGPNRSLIFQAGDIQNNLKQPFKRATDSQPVWWVDGCKIEGISPCGRAGYGPAYVTDDNDLGGMWRAVPASPSLSY